LTVRRIRGVEWTEDFVERMEENTTEAVSATFGALDLTHKIVNEYVKLRQGRAAYSKTPFPTWQGFWRCSWKRCGCRRGRQSYGSIWSRGCVGSRVKTMRWRIPSKTSVGQISNGFGGDTEVRRRVGPAHWEPEREGDHRLSTRLGGEYDAKLGDVGRIETDSVEAVGNVYFDQVYWAKARVGIEYVLENAR
jgi:hypothetical protein